MVNETALIFLGIHVMMAGDTPSDKVSTSLSEVGMPTYRMICSDGDRIVDGFDFDAEDDAEALALLALRTSSNCELWQTGRLIAKVPKGANPMWVEARRQSATRAGKDDG